MDYSYSPLFSILIANYNNGRYLREALKSVYDQTYTNWEIIIVDDASTDDSQAIYQEYLKDSRMHIEYNDSNHGCGYTKRRCAELANGELCGFLDPDDKLTSDALEIMVKEHFNFPAASLIASCYWACDENMQPAWRTHKRIIQEGYSYLTNVEHAPLHFASYKNEYYQKTNGIDADLKRAVDLDLYLKLEEAGQCIYSDQVTYFYRIHDKSVSTKGDFKGLFWHSLVITKAFYRRNIEP